jgi:hypothetical protein
MRIIIASTAFTLLGTVSALADGGGPVSPPSVGTTESAPSTTAPEPAAPSAPKPTLNPIAPSATMTPADKGLDTSTAAPGGQAESSKNGALSTPTDSDAAPKHHKKSKASSSTAEDTKS